MADIALLKPKLTRLKLSGMMDSLQLRFDEAVEEKWSFSDFLFNVNWISLELSSEFAYRYQQEFPGFIISLHGKRFRYAPPCSRRGPVSTVVFGFSLPGPGCRMRACVIL